MGFDKMAGNGQADATPPTGARAGFVYSVEALKNVCEMLRGNADAGV